MSRNAEIVRLCKNPFPYKAMLAICSDLDETPSAEVYLNTADFLNGDGLTAFGRGVNLEVGNTIYFHMPEDQFSYFNASNREQSKIRDLIRSGHVDCFHSFGDLSTSRCHAEEILEHLDKEGCHIRTWVDHATAPSNIGSDIMAGRGDRPGSDSYHVDLSISYGVEYFWLGRVTSTFGQDCDRQLLNTFDWTLPFHSTKTIAKESVKIASAYLGSTKYQMHRGNGLMRDASLRNGSKVKEFIRTNPNPKGVSVGDTATGIADALTPARLHRLSRSGGRAIVYTHLGKQIDARKGFPRASRECLEYLSGLFSSQEILVTTTTRLLDYVSLINSINWEVIKENDRICIHVEDIDSALRLDGLGFFVPRNLEVEMFFRGNRVKTSSCDTGEADTRVLMVPWKRQTYG